ncbi:MAG: ATP synthase F1 subunit gamma, partial [Bacteroidales bacterium]|nr:ATP synthase F1 subunit gamma [Bacteroidales bacterium]
MPALKDIRNRIYSVISTKQVTSAMKMVSAARLRKTQDLVIKFRPYVNTLQDILNNLSANISGEIESPFFRKEPIPSKILAILITSNKGLCGSFNNNIIRYAINFIQNNYSQQLKNCNVDFICIGKKCYDYLKKQKFKIVEYNQQLVNKLKYEDVAELTDRLISFFVEKKYDEIIFFYNSFKNAATQIPKSEKFLPFEPKITETKTIGYNKIYIFEPQADELLNQIIPVILKSQSYKILLDSTTAEHAARMTAMHKATDNANDMIRELRLYYNKVRQANITKELLDIMGGANA